MSDRCSECQAELHVGDWPFCGGNPAKHVRAGSFGFEPMPGYFDYSTGRYYANRSDRRQHYKQKNYYQLSRTECDRMCERPASNAENRAERMKPTLDAIDREFNKVKQQL
jgi:hypothetical protein